MGERSGYDGSVHEVASVDIAESEPIVDTGERGTTTTISQLKAGDRFRHPQWPTGVYYTAAGAAEAGVPGSEDEGKFMLPVVNGTSAKPIRIRFLENSEVTVYPSA